MADECRDARGRAEQEPEPRAPHCWSMSRKPLTCWRGRGESGRHRVEGRVDGGLMACGYLIDWEKGVFFRLYSAVYPIAQKVRVERIVQEEM